ncbi:MAG: hypothetical protein M1600_14635 [Firmicutes bacterium]|nr:hypothetical protein [Bacillota bacterium]
MGAVDSPADLSARLESIGRNVLAHVEDTQGSNPRRTHWARLYFTQQVAQNRRKAILAKSWIHP